MVEVVVIGAGPAGLSLGAALAGRGVDVAIVDPSPSWRNTYGLWADEARDLPVRHTWARTEIVLPDRVVDLGRGYALLDNDAARAHLAASVRVVPGHVVDVTHRTGRSGIALRTDALEARLVVDASNAGTFLTRAGGPTLFQTAWGERLEAGLHPYPADAMRLMDLRGSGTFLYAMPLPDALFVEETRLVGTGRDVEPLREALARRLAADGVTGRVAAAERVCIPLDVPIPHFGRTVGFGASAGLVHPATGYSLGRALRAAPVVAEAIATGLAAGHSPDALARDAWHALWPAPLRRAHALHLAGARLLAGLDADATARFFGAFFSLPTDRWRAYLSGDAPAADVAATMLDVFRAADGATRRHLVREALGPALGSLLRPLPTLAGSVR